MTSVFNFVGSTSDEENIFSEEVGAVVLESALLQYMLTQEPLERQSFGEWVESHAEADDFLLQVCTAYPAFEALVQQEIDAFKSEAAKIISETA